MLAGSSVNEGAGNPPLKPSKSEAELPVSLGAGGPEAGGSSRRQSPGYVRTAAMPSGRTTHLGPAGTPTRVRPYSKRGRPVTRDRRRNQVVLAALGTNACPGTTAASRNSLVSRFRLDEARLTAPSVVPGRRGQRRRPCEGDRATTGRPARCRDRGVTRLPPRQHQRKRHSADRLSLHPRNAWRAVRP